MVKPSAFFKPIKLFIVAGGVLAASHVASFAYCGVVEESAIGPNAQIATFLAKQKAMNSVRHAAGPQAANNADYANSACVLADQVGTRAKCTVQGSYCVNPVVSPRPTVSTPPPLPRQPIVRHSCVTFRAKAIGNSHAQAQELVIQTLGETMAQRGGTLGSPGVTSDAPACFFLDDGTNKVRCEMIVRDCR